MKNLLAAIPMLLATFGLFAQTHPDSIRYEIARGVTKSLMDDDFVGIHDHFNEKMKDAMSAQGLALFWYQTMYQHGKYHGAVDIRSKMVEESELVIQTLSLGEDRIDLKIFFNDSNQISGLFVSPEDFGDKYRLPAYADTSKYTELDIIVNGGGADLPGILTLPKGVKRPPVFIFVHGSGPNDMDESLGPNKVFKDMATGLATKGIASIRYEKRTKVDPGSFSDSSTVVDEVIDDAVAAYELARVVGSVDKRKIYLVWHSLGGMMAPRIAMRCEKMKGIIIMAGNARPMHELLPEQYRYIFNLDGELDEKEEREIYRIDEQVERIRTGNFDKETGSWKLPLGVPASYWLDLQEYDQVAVAAELPKRKRILVTQGGRDYQVTMEDFELWKKGLIGNRDATFLAYPSLNHAFITGKGPSEPKEYLEIGHVEERFLDDLINWIKKGK